MATMKFTDLVVWILVVTTTSAALFVGDGVTVEAFRPASSALTTTRRATSSFRQQGGRSPPPSFLVVPSLSNSRQQQPLLYATVPEKQQEAEVVDAASKLFGDDQQQQGKKKLGEGIPYEQLTIGVLKETFPGENRVSQTPDSVKSLVKAGFTVTVQAGGT